MQRKRIQKLISAGHDGALDPARREVLDGRLAASQEARNRASQLQRVDQWLDDLSAPDPRYGFAERVLARLPEQTPRRSEALNWVDLFRPAPVGVGALAFSVGVLLTLMANGQASGDTATAGTTAAPATEYVAALDENAVEDQLLALLLESE